jgi:transcriptional regulator with XRE-family HTH domain
MSTLLLEAPVTGKPTHLRELVGQRLRRLREHSGVSIDLASRRLHASPSKISRVETGQNRVRDDDLDLLLNLYRVSDPQERRGMFELVCRAWDRPWWHDHRDLLADWCCSYLTLEPTARTIRTYERDFIPGLLQTRDYAEAVIRLLYTDETEINRRVDLRMQRQQMLYSRTSPQRWAVINEAALCQDIGDADVMRGQMEHLIRISARRNIRIQILPLAAAACAAAGSIPFTILRLSAAGLLDVVYLEQMDSAMYLSSEDQCDRYMITINQMCVAAGTPDETISTLRTVLAGSR